MDSALQAANKNQLYASQSTIGSNYDVHGEVAYHFNDQWYIGSFVALNTTRDFATQAVGFSSVFSTRNVPPN